MLTSFKKFRIIGAALLLLALAGCGLNMLRLSYGQAPNLGYWWLDDYFDITADQKPRVRQAIDDWFAWHRRTQLPLYVPVLQRAQQEVMADTTPAKVCAWKDEGQRLTQAAFDRILPQAAALALTLSPAQLEHLERRFDKSNKTFREDFLQPDLRERREAALDLAVKRTEMLYGKLDKAQRQRLADTMASSPFDPQLWLGERRDRQQDLLRILRSADPAAPGAQAAMEARLRQLALEVADSPRPAYRAYQAQLETYNCATIAATHNGMDQRHRETARDRLKGWESDLRSLAGDAMNAAPAEAGASSSTSSAASPAGPARLTPTSAAAR